MTPAPTWALVVLVALALVALALLFVWAGA